MSKPKKFSLSVLLLLAVIAGSLVWYSQHPANQETTVQSSKSKTAEPVVVAKPVFNKKLYSTSDPTSFWVVVNKPRPLSPIDYVPADLVTPNVAIRNPGGEASKVAAVTAKALESLFAGAKADKVSLMLTSGYRSYNYQVTVYNGYVSSMGKSEADKISARPGHSEHQTGLAADVEPANHSCELDVCFANTTEGIWLAANAYKYGFIIRYPADKTTVTGYSFEPWHIRYVGTLLATEMHDQGITTLEEFFNLPGGSNY